MKHLKLIFLASLLVLTPVAVSSQTFKRTTYKTDKLDFGMGGTVTIIGAQTGSIEIEGWQDNQIEVTAEIINIATSSANLEAMDAVNGFILDAGLGSATVTTVGVNDKNVLKKIGKKVSKEVAASEFRINYKIKVPRYADLNINGGVGDFTLNGVDGTVKVNFAKVNARVVPSGGVVLATFGDGNVEVEIPMRGWRGRFADIQLATGRLNLVLPMVFDAEIEAQILRTGSILNSYAALKPPPRSAFTEKSVIGKTGNGGVKLKLTLGDGTLTISETPRNR